jgi:hypothetical protein
MKVYVITKIYGDYEVRTELDSVWDNEIDAEKHKAKLMADNQILRTSQPPYEENDYMLGELSPEQDTEFFLWQQSKYEAEEFREPMVSEFELMGASNLSKKN